MEERKQEPNWTELLEKEYRKDPEYWDLVEFWRTQGRTDEHIYKVLESYG